MRADETDALHAVHPLPAGAGPAAPAKPGPTSPLADKELWIAAKYVEKKALALPPAASTPERLQQWLWEAAAGSRRNRAWPQIAVALISKPG